MTTLHPQQQHLVDAFGKMPKTLDEAAECVISVINQHVPIIGFQWDIDYSSCVSNSHRAPIGCARNFNRDPNLPTGYPGFEGRVWVRFANKEYTGFASDAFANTLTYTGTGSAGAYNGPWSAVTVAYNLLRMKMRGEAIPPRPVLFSWDYRFYLSDFLGLPESMQQPAAEHAAVNEQIAQENVWRILQDLSPQPLNRLRLNHRFLWEHESVKQADQEILQFSKQEQMHV